MSRIGQTLRQLLDQRTLAGSLQAYLLGALVSLGPFIFSVLCLASITAMSGSLVDQPSRQIFTGAVVYVFGGSLILSGLLQVLLTRFLSDKIYRGEYATLIESLFPALLVTVVLLGLSAAPFWPRLEVSIFAKVTIFSLYVTVGCLFTLMVFLTAARRYRPAVTAFLAGSCLSTLFARLLMHRFGLEGLLIGYTAGQFLILALLIDWLTRTFGFPQRWDWGVLRYARIYPHLILIGALQQLGIWIDKFVFWTSELALTAGGFVTAPKYDSATFLAFLTVQPAIVHFFVKIEAEFSSDFQRYYDEVFFRSSYARIEASAQVLRRAVFEALVETLKVQGVITFLCSFLAEEILRAFGLPVSQIGMFRSGVLASLFLVFAVFASVLLLYLDRQREVLRSALLFAASNLGLSLLTLHLGYQYYGFGFAAACLVALMSSLYHLTTQLYNLEFVTFISIPIMGQRRASHRLRARRGGMFGRYHTVSGAALEGRS